MSKNDAPERKLLVEDYDVTRLRDAVTLLISKVPGVEYITLDNTEKSLRISAILGATRFAHKCPPIGKSLFSVGVSALFLRDSLKQRKMVNFYREVNSIVMEADKYSGWIPVVPPTPWQPEINKDAKEIPVEVLDAILDNAKLTKVLETEVCMTTGYSKENGAEVAVFDRLHFCYMQSKEVEACPELYMPLEVFKSMASIDDNFSVTVLNSSRAVGHGKGWFYLLPFVQTLEASLDKVKTLFQNSPQYLGNIDAEHLRAAVNDTWSASSFIVTMEGKDDLVTLTTQWKTGKVVAEVDAGKVKPFKIGVDLRPLNDLLSAMHADVEVVKLYLAGNILLLVVENADWNITYGTITVQLQT